MDLQQLLYWLGTPGAGVVAFWIMDHWPWAKCLPEEPQRWLSLALSGVLALLAWGAQMAMLYQPVPSDWRAGLEQAVALLFTAFGVSQLVATRATAIRAKWMRQARAAEEQRYG